MNPYAAARPGALNLKGSSSSKKKSSKKRRSPSSSKKQHKKEEEEESFEINDGTGRLVSSGTTIHGYETSFLRELDVGDAVIVKHPTTLVDETKIVKMVLSDVSISISSAFSTDLVSKTEFRYVKAPKDHESPEEKTEKRKRLAADRQATALGDYGGEATTFIYQTRKQGQIGGANGWITHRSNLSDPKSRSELLDMRSKFKSDRHCG